MRDYTFETGLIVRYYGKQYRNQEFTLLTKEDDRILAVNVDLGFVWFPEDAPLETIIVDWEEQQKTEKPFVIFGTKIEYPDICDAGALKVDPKIYYPELDREYLAPQDES